jgi:hypothetical protein
LRKLDERCGDRLFVAALGRIGPERKICSRTRALKYAWGSGGNEPVNVTSAALIPADYHIR